MLMDVYMREETGKFQKRSSEAKVASRWVYQVMIDTPWRSEDILKGRGFKAKEEEKIDDTIKGEMVTYMRDNFGVKVIKLEKNDYLS